MNKLRKKPLLEGKFWWGLAIGAILVGWLVSEPAVQDTWRGWGYQADERVTAVADGLQLTKKGERIFRASRPALESQEDFNQHCENQSADISLLGCYSDGRIYVFEITAEELVAANKVTMAHELLHAVWERLGGSEQKRLTELLEQTYRDNTAWFDEELAAYGDQERMEELYTRAGTKLADLPEELERHYSEIFQDRARIVGYYKEYEAPFLRLQSELEQLAATIEQEGQQIETERESYLQELERLNGDVQSFNNCANQAGCFRTEADFAARRQVLVAAETELETQRTALNQRISENNRRIEQYRERQAALGELNAALDSKLESVPEIEEQS